MAATFLIKEQTLVSSVSVRASPGKYAAVRAEEVNFGVNTSLSSSQIYPLATEPT